jgi:phosphodiesterase/alkaline phosphatase D-like protein
MGCVAVVLVYYWMMLFRFRVSSLFVLCFLAAGPGIVEAAELIAGPVVGHTTSTSATIWVETDEPARVTVEYWIESRVHYGNAFPEPISRGRATTHTHADSPFTAVVELSGLRPGGLLHYEVRLDGRPLQARSPQVVSLMPPLYPYKKEPEKLAEFSVAFVSCVHPAMMPQLEIWDEILSHRPSAMLFLGDNNYLPSSPSAYENEKAVVRYMMSSAQRELRAMRGLAGLVAATPTYGI